MAILEIDRNVISETPNVEFSPLGLGKQAATPIPYSAENLMLVDELCRSVFWQKNWMASVSVRDNIQAECLIPGVVQPGYIKQIHVEDESRARLVRKIISQQSSVRITVLVNPALFFVEDPNILAINPPPIPGGNGWYYLAGPSASMANLSPSSQRQTAPSTNPFWKLTTPAVEELRKIGFPVPEDVPADAYSDERLFLLTPGRNPNPNLLGLGDRPDLLRELYRMLVDGHGNPKIPTKPGLSIKEGGNRPIHPTLDDVVPRGGFKGQHHLLLRLDDVVSISGRLSEFIRRERIRGTVGGGSKKIPDDLPF